VVSVFVVVTLAHAVLLRERWRVIVWFVRVVAFAERVPLMVKLVVAKAVGGAVAVRVVGVDTAFTAIAPSFLLLTALARKLEGCLPPAS
jgi:hypothetical protein